MKHAGSSWGNRLLLRAVDLVLVLLLVPFWVPLLFVAMILAAVGQGFPLFYRAERLAKGGGTFAMFKFRTMTVGADRLGPQVASGGDARITPVGRFLRKTKLDEIPQFLHVLRGEMSIVGPRPESPSYLSLYDDNGMRSLQAKPGITGPGAISFFFHDEAIENFEAYYIEKLLPMKLKLDADCSDELLRSPIKTTTIYVVDTVVAIVCKVFNLKPPERIRALITL